MAQAKDTPANAFPFSRTNLPKQIFINNEYVESTSGKKLTVYNPKDGSLVADDVALAGEKDVDAAVAAAKAAFPAWKRVSAKERRDILLKFADLLEKHIESLAELTRITNGMPISIGKHETGAAVEVFRHNAGWIDKFAGESHPQENGFLKITRHEPLGVTAGILPWNAPIGVLSFKAGPALATGNCIIIKPSEKTPFAALALGPLIREAGFPPGVFQVLSGDGSTGALLAGHMEIRKVSFTGSVATGKKVQELAARSNLKKVTLELGGKSPAVVFDDCNLANALDWTVRSILTNTGQACHAATRVYVQEGIYDEFARRYKAALEAQAKTIGDPDSASTTIGPLVDEAQFKRVSGFIERGAAGQGSLLTGGKCGIGVNDNNGKGFFVEPTVFTDVQEDAEINTHEIFGPVAVLTPFKTEEEAIRKANATEYGLMAGVFTQDINRALRVASEFESGMVGINCISLLFFNTPFGGSKQSGIGRELGREALEAYTETKTVMVNLTY